MFHTQFHFLKKGNQSSTLQNKNQRHLQRNLLDDIQCLMKLSMKNITPCIKIPSE